MTAVEVAGTVDVVGQLSLPGFTVGPLGATVTGPIPLESIAGSLRGFRVIEGAWSWIVGDFALGVEAEHGMAVASTKFAESGLNQAHVTRCIGVAEAVPPARRRPALTWTHHEVVSRLDAADQDLWLDRAEAERWSWQELRSMLTESSQARLPGVGWRPREPKVPAVRAILDELGDDEAWIEYQPASGAVRRPALESRGAS